MRTASKLLAVAAACAVAGAAAASGDPALQGCWRSQQIRVTLADGSQHDQNGDCVISYGDAQARSTCHGDKGDTENVSGYEVIEPGRLRVAPLNGGVSSELRYRIEDDWLLIERPLAAAASAPSGRQPVSLQSVSVRDKGAACRPRGDNPLRIGRTPVSSLALGVPDGWEPRLVDPASDKTLAAAVNVNFFVGAFVPRAGSAPAKGPRPLVIVLDDVRHGPLPVRAAEFVEVKKRFARELAPIELSCDQADRACAFLREADGTQVYSELVNVRGRVAMVSATVGREKADASAPLREAVRVFVERIRADNPR